MAQTAKKKPAARKAPAKKKPELTPVERVRTHNQAWLDPISGEEVLLNGGAPSSGARIVDADGEPITTVLTDDGEYFVRVD